MTSPHAISADGLARLNRGSIRSPAAIRRLFERAAERGAWLTSGMDLSVRPRRARVVAVRSDRLELRLENLEIAQRQIHLNLELDEARYFFVVRPLENGDAGRVTVRLPAAVYRAERRDVPRVPSSGVSVDLLLPGGAREKGALVDRCYEGLGVRVPADVAPPVGTALELEMAGPSERAYATVRHSRAADGWRHLGLAVSQVAPARPIPIERRDDILARGRGERGWAALELTGKAVASLPRRMVQRTRLFRPKAPDLEVVEYPNRRGEPLVALIDRVDGAESAPLVVIPPAWGRTKETLLPLAATLVETFRAAGEPLNVLRYDERNRRGESFIDPASRAYGEDALYYTFSGAVEDIHTTLEFAREHPSLRPEKVVLLTVSLASIQGRRAVATDPTGLLAGWISLVGMPDLQSSMRAVTGGIDWVYGLTQGVAFGHQELVGVMGDMDNAGPDGLRHHLGYFEDARRDMAKIQVPLTWIYGRHDGWMSLERVRELMSCGGRSNRRLLEVPTGHQLRSSREALETFQLVAEEASDLLLGRRLEPQLPALAEMEARRAAERARRPRPAVDLRAFWHDYLLGRDEAVGMELMTATSLYRQFMADQVEALAVEAPCRILDLGAGTGDMALHLPRPAQGAHRVAAVDFVPQALRRARSRLVAAGCTVRVDSVLADLDDPRSAAVPLADGSFDAALASLLLSYVESPVVLLREIRRLLRRGGRVVISTPKRDADISKLFSDAVGERLQVEGLFGDRVADEFEYHQAEFLNHAAKVLELEDGGRFRFYDPEELAALLERAGFRKVACSLSFGEPGQFAIAHGIR